MKTLIKLIILLFCSSLLTNCGTLPVEAYIAANCPEYKTESTYNNEDFESITPESRSARTHEDGLAHNKFFLSYRVGVGTEKVITNKLSFQPSLLLSGKGNKSEANGFEEKIAMTYIDIPLLIDYKFGESKFSINGGLQPSLLLNANQKTSFEGNDNTEKVTDQFNTFDFAAILGASYQVTNRIGVNVGYDLGLTNIYKSSDEFGSAFKAQNRMLRFTLKYRLTK